MTVEEREEARRRVALDLLAELRAVEHLSRLGQVEITGAVRHRLVVAHDIDVDVTAEELDAAACFEAVGKIAVDPRVVRVVYRNDRQRFGWLAFDIVCRLYDGEDWVIELYVNGPNASYAGWTAELARELANVLTPEHRRAILELKEALAGDVDYRSMDVYRAVVDGGIRDLDGFLRWRAEHGSAELARWLPGTVPPV